jgi:hypothetical protein
MGIPYRVLSIDILVQSPGRKRKAHEEIYTKPKIVILCKIGKLGLYQVKPTYIM